MHVVDRRRVGVNARNGAEVDVEDRANDTHRIEEALQNGLGFRVEVNSVALNSLPRFEAKGQRFIDQRG